MPGNLSAFTSLGVFGYPIPERSEATPGLFNQIFSGLSANLDRLNSDVSSIVGSSVGTTESVLGFSSNTLRAESGNTIASFANVSINSALSVGLLSMATTGSGFTFNLYGSGVVAAPFRVLVTPLSTDTTRVWGGVFQFADGAATNAVSTNTNEKVALYAESARSSGRSSSIWAANFLAQATDQVNTVYGLEIDVNNLSGSAASSAASAFDGLAILSGSADSCRYALLVGTGGGAKGWSKGIVLTSVGNVGIDILAGPNVGLASRAPLQLSAMSRNMLVFIPSADAPNTAELYGANAANASVLWQINVDGFSAFSGVQASIFRGAADTALYPTLQFSSESSLGLYRSAASTIALSYGTFTVPGTVSANSLVAQSGNTIQIRSGLTGAGSSPWMVDVAGNEWVNTGFSNNYYQALGQFRGADGAQTFPAFAFQSDQSLGWFRSAASVMALSYGGLGIKAGANASCGTAILGSNGSVNVANTYVKTGDLIFLTDQSPGGTLGDLEVGGIRNSSGFTIQSTSVTDTSTVAWLIVRPG